MHISKNERKHRHIIETTRSLLISSSMLKQFWVDVVAIAVYLINLMPSFVLEGISPFKKLTSCHPSYSHLCVFGCTCLVLLPSHERDKLSPPSAIFVFLDIVLSIKDIDVIIQLKRNFVFLEM